MLMTNPKQSPSPTPRNQKSFNSARNSRPIKQKTKNHNHSQKKITNKNLSLSFYNKATLTGCKKIMLDLLPIESVQTEYYPVNGDQTFLKWEKKNGSSLPIPDQLTRQPEYYLIAKKQQKIGNSKNTITRNSSANTISKRKSRDRDLNPKQPKRKDINIRDKGLMRERDDLLLRYLSKCAKVVGK